MIIVGTLVGVSLLQKQLLNQATYREKLSDYYPLISFAVIDAIMKVWAEKKDPNGAMLQFATKRHVA